VDEVSKGERWGLVLISCYLSLESGRCGVFGWGTPYVRGWLGHNFYRSLAGALLRSLVSTSFIGRRLGFATRFINRHRCEWRRHPVAWLAVGSLRITSVMKRQTCA
jgi:hypothetical protein